ncbi:MAG: two-component regulator propeller domain-containing protein [Bacteroidia bacterium]
MRPINIISTFYLMLALAILVSCSQSKKDKQTKSVNERENLDLSSQTQRDTLLFTSGIRSILHDSKGNYWFGSHAEGVCLYDGTSFKYFTSKDGLVDNQVRSIQEDEMGNIWFGTANGISSYDGKKITRPLENSDAESKWIITENDLWFDAGIKSGVYRFDGQKLDYLAFPSPKVINPDNIYSVTGITKGRDGMLWIGTYAGVFGYNGKQFTIINDETLGLTKGIGRVHVRSVFEDSKGSLWIGNNGIGVWMKDGDTIINFSEKYNLIHPASKRGGSKSPAGTLEHVFAIAEDGDGNIWFGDRDNGAWKYDGVTMTNYTIGNKDKSQMIWKIYLDHNKDLLFAMGAGGVYRYANNSFVRVF